MAIVLAMFVPIAIVSWMMLDKTAATRYGLAYAMLYSVAGAYGIDCSRAFAGTRLRTQSRRPQSPSSSSLCSTGHGRLRN
jgi:hypothetical protein